jgi:hypothetical protein
MYTRSILVLAVSVAACVASPVHAQLMGSTRPTIAVTAGKTDYDLSGTGTRNVVALRVQLPISHYFRIEPGVTYMNHRVFDGLLARVHVMMPEVQVQGAVQLGRIEPYLGLGAGTAIRSLEGTSVWDMTVSAAGGVRLELGGGWGLGSELRLRAIDPWAGSTADWGVSLLKRL